MSKKDHGTTWVKGHHRKRTAPDSVTVSFRLSVELLASLDKQRQKHNRTRSAQVLRYVREGIARDCAPPKVKAGGRQGFAPLQVETIHPDGSFTTRIVDAQNEIAQIEGLAKVLDSIEGGDK